MLQTKPFKKGELYPSSTRTFYPLRPIVTIILGGILVALGAHGVISLGLCVWLASVTIVDDIVLFPVIRATNLIQNLRHNRKKLKSWIGIAAAGLGYLFGAFIAYGLIVTVPGFVHLFANIVGAMECHLSVMAACQVLGGGIMHALGKPHLLGMLGGALLAPYLAINVPLMMDIYMMSILVCGFAASYVMKHVMRAAYRLYYGHSNDDGFYHVRAKEVTEKDKQRAKIFGLDDNTGPEAIKNLRLALIEVIDKTKKNTAYPLTFWGVEKCSDSLKDVLYILMEAHTPEKGDKVVANSEAIEKLKEVLKTTKAFRNQSIDNWIFFEKISEEEKKESWSKKFLRDPRVQLQLAKRWVGERYLMLFKSRLSFYNTFRKGVGQKDMAVPLSVDKQLSSVFGSDPKKALAIHEEIHQIGVWSSMARSKNLEEGKESSDLEDKIEAMQGFFNSKVGRVESRPGSPRPSQACAKRH